MGSRPAAGEAGLVTWFRLHPEVSQELAEVSDGYDAQRPGFGLRFTERFSEGETSRRASYSNRALSFKRCASPDDSAAA